MGLAIFILIGLCPTHFLFSFFSLLEKVQSTSGTERKKNPLERFMCQWREVHGKLHPQGTAHTHVSKLIFNQLWKDFIETLQIFKF